MIHICTNLVRARLLQCVSIVEILNWRWGRLWVWVDVGGCTNQDVLDMHVIGPYILAQAKSN